MARKKANTTDFIQQKIENEAREIVSKWFIKNDIDINIYELKIIWLAFIKTGYRCMITSEAYPNLFFEIVRNKKTDETQCSCLHRFEYFVKPTSDAPINFFPTSHKKPIL